MLAVDNKADLEWIWDAYPLVGFKSAILGREYHSQGSAHLANSRKGSILFLVREKNNKNDKNAVKVMAPAVTIWNDIEKALKQYWYQCGYMPRADAEYYARRMDGNEVDGIFIALLESGQEKWPRFITLHNDQVPVEYVNGINKAFG